MSTLYALDDVAEDLARADGESWYALDRDSQDRYRAMARGIEHRVAVDDDDVDPGCDDCDEKDERALELEQQLTAIAELVGWVVDHDEDEEPSLAEFVKAKLETARAEGMKDATVPSRAASAEAKAMRLLIERRVIVERAVSDRDAELDEALRPLVGLVVAHVRGDADDYVCGFDPRRREWRCSCPELKGACSHLRALKMIVGART